MITKKDLPKIMKIIKSNIYNYIGGTEGVVGREQAVNVIEIELKELTENEPNQERHSTDT